MKNDVSFHFEVISGSCSEESEMILYTRVHISNICPYIVDFYVQCRLTYRSHGSYQVSRGDFPTKSWGRARNG